MVDCRRLQLKQKKRNTVQSYVLYSIIKIEINALSLKQLEYRVRIYIHCEILEMFKLESEVPIHMHNIQWNYVCEIYILLLLIGTIHLVIQFFLLRKTKLYIVLIDLLYSSFCFYYDLFLP